MRNKKNISDCSLDEMLTNYCRRTPQYVFRVKREEKTMKKKQFLKYSIVGLCVACILCGGILAVCNMNTKNTLIKNHDEITNQSNKDYGFFVKAYAAEVDSEKGKKIESVKTKIYPEMATVMKSYAHINFDSDGMFVNQDNPLEEGEESLLQDTIQLSFDQVALEITSDKVESFDISTNNGSFIYVNLKNYDKYNKGDGTNIDKYFKNGKEIKNIPYDCENPHNSVVSWLPDSEKLENVAKEEIEKDGKSENDKVMAEYKDKLLKTADDYTDYFGATITITVKYNDGTYESGEIKISFDENGYAYTSMS